MPTTVWSGFSTVTSVGCDFPLKAFHSASERGPSGKPLITFNALKAINSAAPFEVPCGNCMGCKLEHARQWSVRMMHEKKFHAETSFVTLTYDDQHVPENFSVNVRDLQLFMKRLRKALAPRRVRFYACGEYGDLNLRPHYHAILFGYDPPGQAFHSQSERGDKQYTSSHLSSLWSAGLATTGLVTTESCRYVAQYCMKKIKTNDEFGLSRYWRVSPITGELHQVRPEFAVMSRRPGIGQAYVDQFKSDFFPSGYIVVDGVKQAPPRFYKSKLSEEEQRHLKLYAKRQPAAEKTLERRRVRAAVRDARIKKLQRKL